MIPKVILPLSPSDEHLTPRPFFFTDTELGIVSTGVPNTEMGHCEKTIKILKLLDTELTHNNSLSGIQYVVLVDDDTILR